MTNWLPFDEFQIYLEKQIDTVRRRARAVFACSQDLAVIDPAAYTQLLQALGERRQAPMPPSPSGADRTLSPDQRAGLVLFFGAVNFCFVQPYTRREYSYRTQENQTLKRTRGFYTAMVESGIDWSRPTVLAGLKPAEWHRMLQADHEDKLYALDARLERLQRFAAYLHQAELDDTRRLFELLPDAGHLLKCFVDSGLFEDEFLKRAQLTVYMLNPSAREMTGRPIPGLDRFTVMADYRLPQVLYNQGALQITSAALLKSLQEGIPIQSGSSQEHALRAGTIVLGERLGRDLGMAESDLDHLLWEYSQYLVDNRRLTIPHMLVPTDKY